MFQESQEREHERKVFAYVDSQACPRGEQEKITNPTLPHLLEHIKPIKIINVKINFDHMNVCVGKLAFKYVVFWKRTFKHILNTYIGDRESSQYLGLIYFHVLEGTNFT